MTLRLKSAYQQSVTSLLKSSFVIILSAPILRGCTCWARPMLCSRTYQSPYSRSVPVCPRMAPCWLHCRSTPSVEMQRSVLNMHPTTQGWRFGEWWLFFFICNIKLCLITVTIFPNWDAEMFMWCSYILTKLAHSLYSTVQYCYGYLKKNVLPGSLGVLQMKWG